MDADEHCEVESNKQMQTVRLITKCSELFRFQR